MATTRDLVRLAARAAEERKAQNLLALDLRELSSVTDYFIVCSGTSDTHVRAIAETIREQLEARGQRTFSYEGHQEGTWILLDYVDFVVHVFHHEKRLYYGIEDLWADAKQVALRSAAPAAARPAKKPAAVKKPAAAKRSLAAKKPAAAEKATAGTRKAPAANRAKRAATPPAKGAGKASAHAPKPRKRPR